MNSFIGSGLEKRSDISRSKGDLINVRWTCQPVGRRSFQTSRGSRHC